MAGYTYRARNASGRLIEGTLSADDPGDLIEKVQELGLLLIDYKTVKGKVAGGAVTFGRIKRREVILFTVHLSASVEAGVPVVQAIADYAAETENRMFRGILEDVERQVLAGTTLSAALDKHPKAFGELYSAVVATGEASGNLDSVLRDLVSFLEWQEELAGQVKQAAIYPLFLGSMIIGVVVLMMAFTVPRFVTILQSFNVQLPAPTRFLIDLSSFFVKFWWFLVLLPIAFVIVRILMRRRADGRFIWDRLALGTPLFGKLLQKIVLSRFAHYFSMLYSSGIGVLEIFTIIQRVVANEVVRRMIGRVSERVEGGSSITDALEKERLVPSLVLRMISVGEKTGSMDKSLKKVSQYYDREVPLTIRRMFAVFEPLMIIFMGGVVLFIALSIFLPIYRLTSTIGMQK